MALSISIPKPSAVFGGIAHSLESRALHLGLAAAAKLPGDPLTHAFAKGFQRAVPGGSVTRTGVDSWKMVDPAGRVFNARVSGTNMVVRGQDGIVTTVPIVPSVNLPSLPSMPKLPELPGVDVGKMLGGVADSVVGAALRQPAIGGTAIRMALRSQYPEAKVKYDGGNSWTVSNLGMEAPFQVRIKGNALIAERDGRLLYEETLSLRRVR